MVVSWWYRCCHGIVVVMWYLQQRYHDNGGIVVVMPLMVVNQEVWMFVVPWRTITLYMQLHTFLVVVISPAMAGSSPGGLQQPPAMLQES